MPLPLRCLFAAAFMLAALAAFAQPVNDDCAGSTLLTPSADNNCSISTAGTTVGANFSYSACSSGGNDVWYVFVATANAHTLQLSNVVYSGSNFPAYFNVEIFSGPCSDLHSRFCSPWYYSGQDILFGDLTPGEIYFIRMAEPYNAGLDFEVCVRTPPTPPANDACVGATVLDVDPDPVADNPQTGTTQDATISPVPVCNDCYWAYDVWYTFTATQANHIIQLNDIVSVQNPGDPQVLSYQAFSGTCGNFSFIQSGGVYGSGQFAITNLLPGTAYYIRLYSGNYFTPAQFSIGVSSPPPPANDECSGAVPVAVSSGLYCEQYFSGNTYLATASGSNCTGGVINDVWYQFVATSVSHHVQVSVSNYNDTGMELYAGACGNLTSLACQMSGPSGLPGVILNNLTIGSTYFLRLFSGPNTPLDFNGCIETLPAPPANDLCSNAESLPVNPDVSCTQQALGSTLGATGTAQNCLGTAAAHDVWYSFVATQATHRLSMTLNYTSFGDYSKLGYQVFSGSDCNNLTALVCQSEYAVPSMLTGLTPGATYRVRVFSDQNSAHTFTLCLQTPPPPPANGACGSATVLVPAAGPACENQTAGTSAGVLTVTPSTCYFSSGMEVWYSFTATSANHIVRVSDVQQLYGGYDYWLELYSGADCDNRNYIQCYTYPGTILLNNLSIGQTYWLRWMSGQYSAHSFNICIGTLPPPANDDCSNAVLLAVDPDQICDNPTAGTLAGSGFVPPVGCLENGDVWYKFVATQASQQAVFSNVVDILSGYYQPIWAELLTGDCGSLTSLQCWSDPSYATGYLTFGDLVPGQTYYLRVASVYNSALNFDICILTPPPPPANDACANASPLVPEPAANCTPVAGTTQNATSSSGLPVLCCGAGDVWYSFVATQANNSITLSNIMVDGYANGAMVELYSSACSNFVLVESRYAYSNFSWYRTDFVPGATYYIRVSPAYTQRIDFDICVAAIPPPPNDECANALPLPTDLNCSNTLSLSTIGATQSLPNCGNGSTAVNDLWYQFTATAENYRFDIVIITGDYNSLGYELFNGSCNALVSQQCGTIGYTNTIFNVTGLTIGDTYYMRWFSGPNSNHNVSVCARPLPPAPANDDCSAAISLSVDTDLSCDAPTPGTTLSANQSAISCYGSPSQDVWYSFIATDTRHLLEIIPTHDYFGGLYDLGFQLYSGDCDNLVSLFCQSYLYQPDYLLSNLTPGQTYYLRVYSQNSSAHDFTLCLLTLPPPPANDVCAEATPVLPNVALLCDNIYPGTTLGANPGLYSNEPDVWYSFTATSNSHLFELLNINQVLGNAAALNFDVYEGSDCDALIFLGNFSGGNITSLNYLQTGETYYIRVHSSDPNAAHTFDLCVKTLPPSPVNENCDGAFVLTPNTNLQCDVFTSGSTAGAINTSYPSCGSGYDVWYKFTATSNNHWVRANNIVPVVGNGALWLDVVQSGDCSSFTILACGYYDQALQLTGLTPGAEYFVKVTSEYGTAHNYDLCITTLPPPPNDLCPNAIPLEVASGITCLADVSGSTYGAVPSTFQTCNNTGDDVWYSFIATQEAHTVSISNVVETQGGYASYAGVEVYGGTCGNLQNKACYGSLNSGAQFTVGELTAGELYYIRVIPYYYNPINFDICVSTPPPPPANDACANATGLIVSPSDFCLSATVGTTENATPTVGAVYGPGYNTPRNDVWYSFTATQANHLITVGNISLPGSFLILTVFTGSCGSLSQLIQQYGTSNPFTQQLTNLTPGTTYYLQLYEYYDQITDFDICVTSNPVPSNDECTGATPLEINSGLICGTINNGSTYGATQSQPGCSSNAVNDVWYQFTATGTSHRLNIYPTGTIINFYYGIEIYGGNCASLTPLSSCLEYYYANADIVVQGLTAGQTYYVRIFTTANFFQDFGICVTTLPEPPANDDCAQATNILPNEGVVCDLVYAGSTLGATQSAVSCNGYNTHDVWYAFTATSASHIVELQLTGSPFGASGAVGFQAYAGTDCDNLVALQCFEYGANNPMLLTGLNIGATYYLRVFSNYGSAHDFTLCIRTLPPPPANTDCSAAQVVTPNPGMDCENPVPGSTSGLFEYGYYDGGCFTGTSLWYQFTATANVHWIRLENIIAQYGNSQLYLELRQGACSNPALSCGQELYVNNLTIGATYYIRVGDVSQNSGATFNLCILTPQQPANDECAGAVTLLVSPDFHCAEPAQANTLGATASPGSASGCYTGSDIWYKFVATGTTHKINLTNVEPSYDYYQLRYEVMTGACGAWTSLGCFDPYQPVLTNLIPGQTYYVRIGTYFPLPFTFDICITTPRPDPVVAYINLYTNPCGATNNETVLVIFTNQGDAELPSGAAEFTLTVSGANSGTYGPFTNVQPLTGAYEFVYFPGVDLSNTGVNQLTATVTASDDAVPGNNSSTLEFTTLPLLTFYLDADFDGYGNPAETIQDCYAPYGYVANNTDCDDADYYRNPGRTEFCNGVDDDCDGLLDSADPSLLDTLPPGIVCPANMVVNNASGSCSATVSYTVTATDECNFTLTQTSGFASGASFPVGTTVNSFTVNDPGGHSATCSFTVQVKKTGDPELLYAYTLIGFKEVALKKNTVQSGGIGVVKANKKVRLQQGSLVTALNTFVKTPILEIQGGSQATTVYYAQVPSGLLPAFQPNNNPGNNNLNIPNNSPPVTLVLNNYGNVTVGKNVNVTFSGNSTVRIKQLTIKEGAVVHFAQGTTILIDKTLSAEKNVIIYPANAGLAQLFVEGEVAIEKSCHFTVNLYTQATLSLAHADANAPTYMTGLFIADKVEAEANVIWNWDAGYCPYQPSANRSAELELVTERTELSESVLQLFPNPATEDVHVVIEGEGEVALQLFDATGRLVRAESFATVSDTNDYRLSLAGISQGSYVVQVLVNGRRYNARLMVMKP